MKLLNTHKPHLDKEVPGNENFGELENIVYGGGSNLSFSLVVCFWPLSETG